MKRYELRVLDEGGNERYGVFDTQTGHYEKVAPAGVRGRSYSSEFWVESKPMAQGLVDSLNERQAPTMRIRKPGRYSNRIEQIILVAPGHRWHDRGLKLKMQVADWRPGVWNYTEDEYNKMVKALEGYLYFSTSFWEDEPDQDVFDAVCRWMVEKHEEYLRWHQKKVEKYGKDWPDVEPFELPKGTCRYNESGSYWTLTPRKPTFKINFD